MNASTYPEITPVGTHAHRNRHQVRRLRELVVEKLMESRLSRKEIAAHFGISTAYVTGLAKSVGVESFVVSEEERALIMARRLQAKTGGAS